VQNLAFRGLVFRKGATYRKFETNLLRAFDGPMSTPNLEPIGAENGRNCPLLKIGRRKRAKHVFNVFASFI